MSTLSSSLLSFSVPPAEERVAPLEVSRSKLSRHLQGLVFRCHKCTFTCSSDQALQLHLQKHAEVKPYQCQLCYYDGSRRSQLEEHLRVEHKVGAGGLTELRVLGVVLGKACSREF